MKKKFYFRTILLGISLCNAVTLQAQNVAPVFEDMTPVDAPQVYRGNGAWGDYNNDGLMDLVVMGRRDKGDTTPCLTFYTNNGREFTVSTPITIPANTYNTVVIWIDYNNDGNLDLLLVGSTFDGDDDGKGGKEDAVFAKLYKNNGLRDSYSFSEVENCGIKGMFFGQERVYSSMVSVGDYNNDGYPDIALIGNRGGNKVEVYTNIRGIGQFTLLEKPVGGTSSFATMNSGSLAWGDYDGDGFLDLLVTGWMDSQTNLKLYRNKGDGTFEETLSQTDVSAPYKGQIGWLDANGDGLLDFIVSGETKAKSSQSWGKTTDIYIQGKDINEAVTFTRLEDSGLLVTIKSAIDYADLNSDGLLDILISGDNSNLAKTSVAMYDGSKYSLVTATGDKQTANGFEGFRSGTSLALYDYDNDGYLDFFVMGYNAAGSKLKIYRNTGLNGGGNQIALNTAPTEPSNLIITSNEGKTTFSWTAGSDVETPAVTLRYNLFIKKINGEVITLLPADLNTGKLEVSDCTIATMQTSYTLNIAANEIAEWGVQTIDQGKMTSQFAKQSVLYRQCYTDGGWETICLPFNVEKVVDEFNADLAKDSYILKELTAVKDGILYYTEVEDGMMKANIPYILSLQESNDAKKQKKQYIFYGGAMSVNENPSVKFEGYSFTGVYKDKSGAESSYVLNAEGTAFVKGIGATVIPAYCAYITAPVGTSLKSIKIAAGGATDLKDAEMETMRIYVQNGCLEIVSSRSEFIKIYSIDGCLIKNVELMQGVNQIENLSKGIYLISNTKVVIN